MTHIKIIRDKVINIVGLKFSHTRLDVAQDRSEYNQTYRLILPMVALWGDGYRYNQVGIQFGWWKWTLHIFFNIV